MIITAIMAASEEVERISTIADADLGEIPMRDMVQGWQQAGSGHFNASDALQVTFGP